VFAFHGLEHRARLFLFIETGESCAQFQIGFGGTLVIRIIANMRDEGVSGGGVLAQRQMNLP